MQEGRRVADGSVHGRREHFSFLDGVRGLACLWVVLDHLHTDLLGPELPDGIVRWVFDSGILGVIVFFVLSGFVISHSWRHVLPGRAMVTAPGARSFLVRRWIRLSPPYYVALVIAVAVTVGGAIVLDDGGQPPTAWSWVAHLLYLPGIVAVEPVNAVFWTLAIEMQFYVCMVAVMWMLGWAAQRSVEWLQTSIVLLAIAALVWPLRGFDLVNQPTIAAYGFAFLAGMLAYWWWAGVVDRGLFWVYQAILLVASVRWRQPIIGVAAVGGPMLVLATGGDRMRRWLGGSRVQYLGAISYSLYLVHAPVIGVVTKVGESVFGASAATQAAMIVPAVLASIAAGAVLHRTVEVPALAWSRARRLQRDALVAVT